MGFVHLFHIRLIKSGCNAVLWALVLWTGTAVAFVFSSETHLSPPPPHSSKYLFIPLTPSISHSSAVIHSSQTFSHRNPETYNKYSEHDVTRSFRTNASVIATRVRLGRFKKFKKIYLFFFLFPFVKSSRSSCVCMVVFNMCSQRSQWIMQNSGDVCFDVVVAQGPQNVLRTNK